MSSSVYDYAEIVSYVAVLHKKTQDLTAYKMNMSSVTAEEFEQVQKDVAEILKGRILVGHAIKNDLKVILIKLAVWNKSEQCSQTVMHFQPSSFDVLCLD